MDLNSLIYNPYINVHVGMLDDTYILLKLEEHYAIKHNAFTGDKKPGKT